MKGYKTNIENDTIENKNFRKVVYTGKNSQLVLMSIGPKEEIGMEVHDDIDQFFRFEAGKGLVNIDDVQYDVSDGDAVVVPAGARHNIVNVSEEEPLKLYTIYSPPEHQDQIVKQTKQQAMAEEEHFDGKTTE